MPLNCIQHGRLRIEYDADCISDPRPLFASTTASGTDSQRGSARFLTHEGHELAAKHYHRGGLLGRLVRDTYFALPWQKTRMSTELDLLYRLRQRQLPVPRPVAACWRRRAGLWYRGDLVTQRIAGARTLYERLCEEPLSPSQWGDIGRMIARFHEAGVCHADLNATNILLDGQGRAWLIDFDKGRIRAPGRWRQGNLQRLRRSLGKLQDQNPEMQFRDTDWQGLLSGYRSGDTT